MMDQAAINPTARGRRMAISAGFPYGITARFPYSLLKVTPEVKFHIEFGELAGEIKLLSWSMPDIAGSVWLLIIRRFVTGARTQGYRSWGYRWCGSNRVIFSCAIYRMFQVVHRCWYRAARQRAVHRHSRCAGLAAPAAGRDHWPGKASGSPRPRMAMTSAVQGPTLALPLRANITTHNQTRPLPGHLVAHVSNPQPRGSISALLDRRKVGGQKGGDRECGGDQARVSACGPSMILLRRRTCLVDWTW